MSGLRPRSLLIPAQSCPQRSLCPTATSSSPPVPLNPQLFLHPPQLKFEHSGQSTTEPTPHWELRPLVTTCPPAAPSLHPPPPFLQLQVERGGQGGAGHQPLAARGGAAEPGVARGGRPVVFLFILLLCFFFSLLPLFSCYNWGVSVRRRCRTGCRKKRVCSCLLVVARCLLSLATQAFCGVWRRCRAGVARGESGSAQVPNLSMGLLTAHSKAIKRCRPAAGSN